MSEAVQLQPHVGPFEESVTARYEMLIRVSQAVSAYREPRKLFEVLVDELRRVIEFDGIGIAQYDEAKDAIAWHVSLHCGEPNPVLNDKCVQKETMTCWVFQNQRPLVIPFVNQETRFPDTIEFLKKHNMQSVCMLPLSTAHRRIGSMFLASDRPNAYSGDEVRFLVLVADQIALAIDEQLKLLLDLTNSVISTLDLRELLRSVSKNLRNVMSCDLVGVGVPDAQNNKHLRLYALDFPDSEGFVREEVLIPIEGTPPGTAFNSGEPVMGMMRDLCSMIPDSPALAEGLTTGCILPLTSRGRRHGVLLLGRRDENPFSRDDIRILDAAGQPGGDCAGERARLQKNCGVERKTRTGKTLSRR
jgi:formate hydrogenlyase transcriptional activator